MARIPKIIPKIASVFPIYFIYLPDEKPINAKMSGYPFLLRMNPFFDEIFLISSNNEIEIWEISKLQKNCFEKIKIKEILWLYNYLTKNATH